jgi:hypothetical protein
MFIFTKIFTPDLYEKYIKIHHPNAKTDAKETIIELDAEKAMESLK